LHRSEFRKRTDSKNLLSLALGMLQTCMKQNLWPPPNSSFPMGLGSSDLAVYSPSYRPVASSFRCGHAVAIGMGPVQVNGIWGSQIYRWSSHQCCQYNLHLQHKHVRGCSGLKSRKQCTDLTLKLHQVSKLWVPETWLEQWNKRSVAWVQPCDRSCHRYSV
jgi:hypothetical protein